MFHLFFLFLISLSSFAQATEQLAFTPKWQKLLHYKKTLLFGYKSEADDKKFFLHENGKYDPVAEFKKSVELFSSTTRPNNEDAACRFPARFKWLNQQLGNPWKVNFTGCKTYLEFFSKMAARRASIIFSSYYLTNPNSAFGHTLLRLSRFENKNETEMLDYGINYAAEARAEDPLTYAVKGLFGGYPGRFTAIPYYYKIREYSDHEFRDLWSYELNLTVPQVLEMVDHIWELGHTYFDYFYFHENCSYHLLSIIDVIMPERDLTGQYHLFTIPADTVRLLHQNGLIDEGKRRESSYSRLMNLSKGMSSSLLVLAKEIAKNPDKAPVLLAQNDPKTAANILDVAIEAFDYYNADKILSDDPKTREKKYHILKARAENPIITQIKAKENVTKDSPSLSHGPSRLSWSQGYSHGQGNLSRLEFRFALHDILDPRAGSLKEAQIEMGKINVARMQRRYEESRFIFDNFTLFDLKNYPGQNFWSSPMSWELEVGMRQVDLTSCLDCPTPVLNGSVGNSLELFDKRFLMALLINGEFNLQSYFRHGYRAGLGPKIVTRFILTEKWVFGLSVFHHFNTYKIDALMSDRDLRGDFELRHHIHTNLSIFTKIHGRETKGPWMREAEMGLRYFF